MIAEALGAYCAVLTCAARADALQRTCSALAQTPFPWSIHRAPDLSSKVASNRAGYAEILRAAQASGAAWLLSCEDDTEPVARADWEVLARMLRGANSRRLELLYLADRRQSLRAPVSALAGEPIHVTGRLLRGLQAFALDLRCAARVRALLPTVHLAEAAFIAAAPGTAALVGPLFVERRHLEPSLLAPPAG